MRCQSEQVGSRQRRAKLRDSAAHEQWLALPMPAHELARRKPREELQRSLERKPLRRAVLKNEILIGFGRRIQTREQDHS